MSGLTPHFAFSFSGYKSFKTCPRRYYLSKIGSWEGWERSAPVESPCRGPADTITFALVPSALGLRAMVTPGRWRYSQIKSAIGRLLLVLVVSKATSRPSSWLSVIFKTANRSRSDLHVRHRLQ